MKNDGHLTAKQLGELFNVCQHTIRQMERRGMPCVHLGPRLRRFDRRACLDWAKAQGVATEAKGSTAVQVGKSTSAAAK